MVPRLVVAIVLIVVTAKVSIGVRIGTVATIVVVASAALDSISVGIVAVVAIAIFARIVPLSERSLGSSDHPIGEPMRERR